MFKFVCLFWKIPKIFSRKSYAGFCNFRTPADLQKSQKLEFLIFDEIHLSVAMDISAQANWQRNLREIHIRFISAREDNLRLAFNQTNLWFQLPTFANLDFLIEALD